MVEALKRIILVVIVSCSCTIFLGEQEGFLAHHYSNFNRDRQSNHLGSKIIVNQLSVTVARFRATASVNLLIAAIVL
jgi:hypothetical protein